MLSLIAGLTCCRYDFGITAWTLLNIKAKGAQDLTLVYKYLESHSEVLGLVLACSSVGGTAGGAIGRFVSFIAEKLKTLFFTSGVTGTPV